MKYRKKPIVIEAFHMTPDRYWDRKYWPAWLLDAWYTIHNDPGVVFMDTSNSMQIRTLEGLMQVNYGDYIIKGIQGELYPCKPDIFEETYEEYHA